MSKFGPWLMVFTGFVCIIAINAYHLIYYPELTVTQVLREFFVAYLVSTGCLITGWLWLTVGNDDAA
jgi:hypothetical protein